MCVCVCVWACGRLWMCGGAGRAVRAGVVGGCWWFGLPGSIVERGGGGPLLGAGGSRELLTREGGGDGSRARSREACQHGRAGAQRRRAGRAVGTNRGRWSSLLALFSSAGVWFFGRGILGRLVVFQDRVDCIFSDFGVFSLIWLCFLPITLDYT